MNNADGINYTLKVSTKKDVSTATVRWSNGVKTNYKNQCTYAKDRIFIIPHKDKGFYYLNGNKIVYVISATESKTVVCDDTITHNWYGSFDSDDLIYSNKYNVLICTRLKGDHDYIWWFNLNEYDQKADISEPTFYNYDPATFIHKFNDRYVIAQCKDDDSGIIMIFDTKNMIYTEYESFFEFLEKNGLYKDI